MLKCKIIVGILFFCFLFAPVLDAAILLDRVVALVNKEVITWSELYKTMEQEASAQLKALNDEERMKIFKENEAGFLEKLIDIRLQIQEAKRLGIGITSEEVMDAIENIKSKYSLTAETLNESIKKEGLSFEEYKERLSEQIIISKLISQQVRNKVVVSDEDIKRYIEKNYNNDSFKLRQIFFKKTEYDADRNAIEKKALLVIQRLKAGEDFSELAKEYSQDPSGRLGGDIGYIKKGDMDKEFIKALSTMNVGDFSSPFWTEKGLHIIKLEEKISVENMEELKRKAREQLAEHKFSEKYESWLRDLREKAYIVIRL
ncbi:MAG: peptidylprolyl isomerase [Nitrospirota bacterium]